MHTARFTLFFMFSFFTITAMQEQQKYPLTMFHHFCDLQPELQKTIFQVCVNKDGLQKTNRFLYNTCSITTPGIFNEEFCKSNTAQITRILLKAAYFQRFSVVENILDKSTYLKCRKDTAPFIVLKFDEKKYIIDSQTVLQRHKTEEIKNIFDKHKISSYDSKFSSINKAPSSLVLACYYNNHDLIGNIRTAEGDIKKALILSIDFERIECIEKIINNYHGVIDIYAGPAYYDILSFDRLKQACYNKKLRALEFLLERNYFTINQNMADTRRRTVLSLFTASNDALVGPITVSYTILDDMLKKEKEDSSYAPVVKLLTQYGAKTMEQIESERCVIF
jgi:hypothetical protein